MSDLAAVDVPGYRIVSRIMAGGMATVYVAEQLKLSSRRVALKIFRSQNTDHTKARYKRFAQEAMIARSLQHPHIVQIFDYGSTDEFQFLVMEYLAHGDLKQRIREGLQPQQALRILQQVANALALLHQSDVVHRDIKPANILFREPDHAVLADFGIARSIEQNTQLTNTGFVLGTPSYMSPEQINGGRITAQTDIYALGVVFYEMLTGRLPYRGDSVQSVATQHLMAPVPPLPLEVRRLQPLLNRLMAKKPQERIASGSELLHALERIDFDRSFAIKPPSYLQLHARKIVAVAALMGCSVAITWASISQLPMWLGDVATPADTAGHEPAAQSVMMPAPPSTTLTSTSPEPAPPPVAPPPVTTVTQQPASVAKVVVSEPGNTSDKQSVNKSAVKKQAVKERQKTHADLLKANHNDKDMAATAQAEPAVALQRVSNEEKSAPGGLQQVAEQRASYDVVTDDVAIGTAPLTPPAEAQPVSDVSTSSSTPIPSATDTPTSGQQKKPLPVISYF